MPLQRASHKRAKRHSPTPARVYDDAPLLRYGKPHDPVMLLNAYVLQAWHRQDRHRNRNRHHSVGQLQVPSCEESLRAELHGGRRQPVLCHPRAARHSLVLARRFLEQAVPAPTKTAMHHTQNTQLGTLALSLALTAAPKHSSAAHHLFMPDGVWCISLHCSVGLKSLLSAALAYNFPCAEEQERMRTST